MGLQFTMSAVNNKRVVATNNEPTLVANSTKAKFSLTGMVSRIMGLMPGDYVQFISNIASIDNAIVGRSPEIVEWCEQNNFEFGTEQARTALIKEFGEYAICKGVALFDEKGVQKTTPVRMTDKQKRVAFEMDKEEIVAKIAAELGKNPEDVTVDDWKPTTPLYAGAKTATTSNLTGVGLPLGFSDTNMWNELKEDLGEAAEEINRVFEVNLQEPFEVEVENGKKDGVEVVKAYPFTYRSDEEPLRSTKKNS